MRLVPITAGAALAIVGFISTAHGEEAAASGTTKQLKLNLAPGDSRRLSLKFEVDVHWSSHEQTIDAHLAAQMDLGIVVQKVDAKGDYVMQLTQQRLAYSLKGSPFDLSFDSDQPIGTFKDESPQARAFIGQPIQLKVDSTGQPLEVLDVDQLADALKSKIPNITPESARQTADSVITAMKLVMAPLPKTPVGAGDKWRQQLKAAEIETDATYKLSAFRDTAAHVILIGAMSFDLAKLKGPMHGQIEIDEKTGWLKSEVIDLELTNADTLKVTGKLTVSGK